MQDIERRQGNKQGNILLHHSTILYTIFHHCLAAEGFEKLQKLWEKNRPNEEKQQLG